MHKDSILIVREHANEFKNPVNHALMHIEHLIHSVVLDGQSLEDFSKEYYGNYKSKESWLKLFYENGLATIYCDEKPQGPTHYFYFILKLL